MTHNHGSTYYPSNTAASLKSARSVRSVKSARQTTPDQYRPLGAAITQVRKQLKEYYPSDRMAISLLRDLRDFKETLNSRPEKQAAKELGTKLKAFTQTDTLTPNGVDPDSLVYPLRTALAGTFPQNTTDDKSKFLKAHRKNRDASSQSPNIRCVITEDQKNNVIPTPNGLLHFVDFILEDDSFPWQDKIRAVYHAKQHGIEYATYIPLTLPSITHLNTEEAVPFRLNHEKGVTAEGTQDISLMRIAYYICMIKSGTSLPIVLFWDQIWEYNPRLSEFITMVCEYRASLSDSREEKLQNLEATIKNHPLTLQYLQSGEKENQNFQDQIESLIANLSSPRIYELVSSGQLTLENALNASQEQRTLPREVYRPTRKVALRQDRLTEPRHFLISYLEEYNAEQAKENQIHLTKHDIEQLRPLEKYIIQFVETLDSYQLANKVLCKQHGWTNSLIDALIEYGDFWPLLSRRQIKRIIERAARYCLNAQTDIILHAIESGLPPEQGLALSNTDRAAFKQYDDILSSILSRLYSVGRKERKRYIRQRLAIHIAGCTYTLDSNDESIRDGIVSLISAMQQDIPWLENDILGGLNDKGILSLEEIFAFDSELLQRFHDIDRSWKSTEFTELRRDMRRKSYYNSADLLSREDLLTARNTAADINDFFEDIITQIENIWHNCNSIYSKYIISLYNLGLSYQAVVTMPSSAVLQLKANYESAREAFNKYLSTERDKSMFSRFSDSLLPAIVQALPQTKPAELYPLACQVIQHASSPTLKKYYRRELLTRDQIIRLQPGAKQRLEATYSNFARNYEEYSKNIIMQHIPIGTGTFIEAEAIDAMVEAVKRVPQYLKLPIFAAISQNRSVDSIVNTVLTENTYSEDSLKQRFSELENNPEVETILDVRTYDTFLLAALQADPTQPIGENQQLLLDNVMDCSEQYLTNLQEIARWLEYGFDSNPMMVITSTAEEQHRFWELYGQLVDILQDLPANSDQDNFDALSSDSASTDSYSVPNQLLTNIIANSHSFQQVITELEETRRCFDNPDIKYLISRVTKAVYLPRRILRQISSCLVNITPELPEEKQEIYDSFGHFVNRITGNLPDAMKEAAIRMDNPIARALLQAQQCTTHELLRQPEEWHEALQGLNSQLNSIKYGRYKYIEGARMAVGTIDADEPRDLIAVLTIYVNRLGKRSIFNLIKIGVSAKVAVHLGDDALRNANKLRHIWSTKLNNLHKRDSISRKSKQVDNNAATRAELENNITQLATQLNEGNYQWVRDHIKALAPPPSSEHGTHSQKESLHKQSSQNSPHFSHSTHRSRRREEEGYPTKRQHANPNRHPVYQQSNAQFFQKPKPVKQECGWLNRLLFGSPKG